MAANKKQAVQGVDHWNQPTIHKQLRVHPGKTALLIFQNFKNTFFKILNFHIYIYIYYVPPSTILKICLLFFQNLIYILHIAPPKKIFGTTTIHKERLSHPRSAPLSPCGTSNPRAQKHIPKLGFFLNGYLTHWKLFLLLYCNKPGL